MRDEQQPLERRMDAAKSACPFLHARLQTLQHSGPDGGPIGTQTATIIDSATLTQKERDALRQVLFAAKARAVSAG
jgi:hypothetical protein